MHASISKWQTAVVLQDVTVPHLFVTTTLLEVTALTSLLEQQSASLLNAWGSLKGFTLLCVPACQALLNVG